jgi:hypothetical protein
MLLGIFCFGRYEEAKSARLGRRPLQMREEPKKAA